MIVRWHRPGRPALEWNYPDLEQLLFLLRLVPNLQLEDESFRFVRASLVIKDEELSVAIWLTPDAG